MQLSSEREGLRRQLVRAQAELDHAATAHDEAHEYRLANSRLDFRGWVIDKLVEADLAAFDPDALLTDNIPRGSSAEEMAPYLNDLIDEVALVKATVAKYIRHGDVNTLQLDDLRKRGLALPEAQEDLYYGVLETVTEQLPEPPRDRFTLTTPRFSFSVGGMGITSPANLSADLRRLDDSIRDEQDLAQPQDPAHR